MVLPPYIDDILRQQVGSNIDGRRCEEREMAGRAFQPAKAVEIDDVLRCLAAGLRQKTDSGDGFCRSPEEYTLIQQWVLRLHAETAAA